MPWPKCQEYAYAKVLLYCHPATCSALAAKGQGKATACRVSMHNMQSHNTGLGHPALALVTAAAITMNLLAANVSAPPAKRGRILGIACDTCAIMGAM